MSKSPKFRRPSLLVVACLVMFVVTVPTVSAQVSEQGSGGCAWWDVVSQTICTVRGICNQTPSPLSRQCSPYSVA